MERAREAADRAVASGEALVWACPLYEPGIKGVLSIAHDRRGRLAARPLDNNRHRRSGGAGGRWVAASQPPPLAGMLRGPRPTALEQQVRRAVLFKRAVSS
jgi:hypothetical protein